ncbi:TonB-dependent receptor plug domain-containing protein [Candidatus Binatus sp.]|uniref:TonB-dependent receptor plug domain-containing protein n=1 Tax=Candidatus Binatus sp. TaxID=2811406 RepID=UPI002F934492
MQFSSWILSTIVAISLFAPIARAQEPASAPSPAQTQTKSAPAKPKAAPPATPPKKQEAQKLNPVVVTATRIEQPIADIGTTITVVEDPQIQEQKIDRVGDVLRQVPGLQVTQSGSPGSVTDVSIRGATSAQTLILVDGVEVNSGATGGFDLANLTTDNLDRIEVLRGAGGSLYGSQAIGGVVNVLSREGEGAPTASLVSAGGNRATSQQVATVSGADGNLHYSGAVSYFSTEGFRPVNDNSDNLSLSSRLDYHLGDDTVIRGFARYSASNVSLPNFLVFDGVPLDPTAHDRNEFMLFKGEVEHHFGENLMVRASAFFVRQDLRLNAPPFPAGKVFGAPYFETDSIPDETRGGLAEAIYTWTEGFRTVAGFDFKDRWVRSGSSCTFCEPVSPFGAGTTTFHARRQEYAGYLEQEGSFLDGHLLVTGGFRVDGNSQFGKEVSPAWSVAIPITKISTTLRGSYSEGFRAPAFNELYYPNYGNPNLQPEISSEYDGGFTTNFGERASLTATYFSRRVHNLIVTVPCKYGPSCLFGAEAGNAARVDVQGVEVVPSLTIVKGLTLSGNVTVLDETHKDAPLNFAKAFLTPPRPLRVAKHTASALLQYVRSANFLPNDRITASVNYIFVGDRDDITVSGVPPIANHAAYNLVSAVVSYAMGIPLSHVNNEEVFARVSNLMDRDYSEAFGFPAPTINVLAGVKLDFD